MSFTPNASLLCFQRGEQTEAFAWMRSLFPDEPAHAPMATLPLATEPDPALPAKEQKPLAREPIQPRGPCPETGRPLRLHLFRDMSAVILREAGTGLEVLPATLAVPAEIHDISLKSTPYRDRAGTVPALRLQARPEGLRWDMALGSIDEAGVLSLFAEALTEKAGLILAAGPIVDPRAHAILPDGARYAPFSRWPGVDRRSEPVQHLARVVRALAQLRAERTGATFRSIDLRRRLPPEPWREGNLGGTATSQRAERGVSPTRRDKTFDKALRGLLASEGAGLPDALRYGPEDRLAWLENIGPAGSAHAALACLEVLRDVAPDIDTQPFLAA